MYDSNFLQASELISRLIILGNEQAEFIPAKKVPVRYIDHQGNPTEIYPMNPNGSPEGIAGATSLDGRVTMLMPHPERVHRTVQHSWAPEEWGEEGPWLRMFRNARVWVG